MLLRYLGICVCFQLHHGPGRVLPDNTGNSCLLHCVIRPQCTLLPNLGLWLCHSAHVVNANGTSCSFKLAFHTVTYSLNPLHSQWSIRRQQSSSIQACLGQAIRVHSSSSLLPPSLPRLSVSRYPGVCLCPSSQVEPTSVLHMDGGPSSCKVLVYISQDTCMHWISADLAVLTIRCTDVGVVTMESWYGWYNERAGKWRLSPGKLGSVYFF